MTTASDVEIPRSSGRWLVVCGLGLALLAIAAYAAQFAAHRLLTPWYLPVATTLGAVLIGAALGRRRGIGRWAALVVVALLAGAEWLFLFATRLPEYTGPVAVGERFPSFEITRADGTPFAGADLRDDGNNVLVFFRGRW
ncbi:MAG TPA: hypothetical protein VJ783_09465 [Pirellulales bacterium]|nr:hypothetical protein [Pirellulales bacterium]